MISDPKHIIISRTDNIGDVVLTLPLVYALRQQFPNTSISFLARDYVKAIIMHCEAVDQFISWDDLNAMPLHDAVRSLKKLGVTYIIHVFPRSKIAMLAQKAEILHRIGTSGRWYHWIYCNHRVRFSRTRSGLHEAELNFKLLQPFKIQARLHRNQITLRIKKSLQSVQSYLDPTRFNLIIHPLSHGHGREWPLEEFAKLIRILPPKTYRILVTGSVKESQILQACFFPLLTGLTEQHVIDLSGKLDLSELLILIQHSDGLLANSTGPLHLAASMGIHTLGLFADTPLIGVTRWGPIGPHAQTLSAHRACDKKHCRQTCLCMLTIHPRVIKEILDEWTITIRAARTPA